MASAIARTSEYMTVTVVVLLAFSTMISACSSTPPETTGSIATAPPPAPVAYAPPPMAYTPPPIINAPATVPAAQPVAYAPRQPSAYAPGQPACVCSQPRKYDRRYNRDITASIPRSTPAPRQSTDFVAHVIGPRETLYSISRRYHTRTVDIAAVNRINTDSQLRAGEILVVPVTR